MNCPTNIGVIIPVYNCERYVGAAIESVLFQPYSHIHIILVDDGSVDSSPEICDRYADQYSCVHTIHKENGGVSSARNAGIEYILSELADTEYIAFLDADDMWIGDFLTPDVLTILSQGVHLAGFQTARCNSTVTRYRAPAPMAEGFFPGGNAAVWLNSSQTFGAAFYALSVIRQYSLRFPDGLKVNEDVIFSMQYKYLAETIFLSNRLLYLYRNNQASASHKRVNAIFKYVPVIDAYLASDRMMQAYQNDRRGILREGNAMAAVYIVDMCEEHYQALGHRRKITEILNQKPEYLELITGSFACDRSDSGLRWRAMNARPVRFRLTQYAKGIVQMLLRSAFCLLNQWSVAAGIIDKKRYPLEIPCSSEGSR